ncbi:hypothetical protein GOQ04_19815 [Emticicia sp. ODNR4P]|jgi:DNA-binding LytR/AlgR family response regulator|nr:hypothetical protein [Emticicia sp. ODNR4P]
MRPVQFYSLYIDLTQDIRLELDVFPRNISFYFTNASSLDHARNLIEQEYFEVIIFNVDNVGEEEVCLIADIPKNTSIIVISNDYDTIFDPHDIDNVILFTLKPIDPEKLQNLLIRFLSKYVLPKVKHLDHFDFFFTGSEMTKINFNDIFYVEAVGTFSNVFLLDQVILVKESISSLEERLPSKNFVRLHRSFIINTQKILRISSKEIELNNAKKLPIGRSYRNKIGYISYLIDRLLI